MTIQEAIKTGKPIRRTNKCFCVEYGLIKHTMRPEGLRFEYGECAVPLTLDDILADDWEVKREPMVIWVNVYSDFDVAYAHETKEDAVNDLVPGYHGVTKKFIEVIDENK